LKFTQKATAAEDVLNNLKQLLETLAIPEKAPESVEH
jgi:hypothetical protein